MTKFALTLAAIATAAALTVAQPLSAQAGTAAATGVRIAQADVKVRVDAPTVKERVVVKKRHRKHVTVVTKGRHCRTVTVRKRVDGKIVVKKTRRCR